VRALPLRARAATVVAAAAVLFVAACAPTGTPDDAGDGVAESGRFDVNVDVDTPALRAAKKRAGIADCPAPSSPPPTAENTLPDVTLACLGGGPDVDLSQLSGPMVVNLWAQWCGPCREELPHYQRLHEKAGDAVQVLGIDYQDTRPAWAIDLLHESGVTYPSLADPSAQLRVPLRVRGLPGLVLVDEAGEVVAVEYVVIDSYEQLAGLVEEHLGVDVGAAG
jgi:thiol-disulfide isomerase/thioredoxin